MKYTDYKNGLDLNSLVTRLTDLSKYIFTQDNIEQFLDKLKTLNIDIDRYTKYVVIKDLLKEDSTEYEEVMSLSEKFNIIKIGIANNIQKKFLYSELYKRINPNRNDLTIYLNSLYNIPIEPNKTEVEQIKKEVLVNDPIYPKKIELLKNYMKLTDPNKTKLEKVLSQNGLDKEIFYSLINKYKEHNIVVGDFEQTYEDLTLLSEIIEALEENFGIQYLELISNISDCMETRDNIKPTTCSSYGYKPVLISCPLTTIKIAEMYIHELGHCIHHLVNNENNSFGNNNENEFLSEIVALVNEFLLFNHLLKKQVYSLDTANALLSLVNWDYADSIKSLKLEDYLHNNIDNIDNNYVFSDPKYLEHLNYAFNDYYNFNYAYGIIIAFDIASRIINKKISFNQYYEILSSPSYLTTQEILSTLGININSMEYLKTSVENLNGYIDNIKQQLYCKTI